MYSNQYKIYCGVLSSLLAYLVEPSIAMHMFSFVPYAWLHGWQKIETNLTNHIVKLFLNHSRIANFFVENANGLTIEREISLLKEFLYFLKQFLSTYIPNSLDWLKSFVALGEKFQITWLYLEQDLLCFRTDLLL